MTILISMIIGILITTIYFKVVRKHFKMSYFKDENNKFNNFMDRSLSVDKLKESDLISFRHEFGETIFELQKEINILKEEIFKLNQINSHYINKEKLKNNENIVNDNIETRRDKITINLIGNEKLTYRKIEEMLKKLYK